MIGSLRAHVAALALLSCGGSCVLVQRVIEPPCPAFDDEVLAVPASARVLVLSKTHGYRHDSIPSVVAAVERAAASVGLSSFATASGAAFTTENLARVDVVVFASANGTVLSPVQEAAFRAWVEEGGAVLMLHGAVGDFDRTSPWWWRLIGARFVGHTLLPNIVRDVVHVTPHEVTARLPASFVVEDEIYSFTDGRMRRDQILLRTRTGPISWLHRVGRGTVLVFALGHTDAQWSVPTTSMLLEDALSYLARHRPS